MQVSIITKERQEEIEGLFHANDRERQRSELFQDMPSRLYGGFKLVLNDAHTKALQEGKVLAIEIMGEYLIYVSKPLPEGFKFEMDPRD